MKSRNSGLLLGLSVGGWRAELWAALECVRKESVRTDFSGDEFGGGWYFSSGGHWYSSTRAQDTRR